MSNRTSTWLPIYGDIFANKKVATAAKALTRDNVHAMVGHLAALWLWCLECAQDGDLAHLSDRAIAQAAGWPKAPSKFVATLLDVGLLDPDRKLHDWEWYTDRLIGKRKRDAARKREEYEAKKGSRSPSDSPSENPSESPRDLQTHRTVTVPHRTGKSSFADTDSSGQVSDAAPSGISRGPRGSRLTDKQILETAQRLLENGEWPLDLTRTRAVLNDLARDQDLPVGDLEEALVYYNDFLESSPLEAKSSKAVAKAMRPWLTSWLRRDHLNKLMSRGNAPDRERAREALKDSVLGTDQYSEMSNSDIEYAIRVLTGTAS